MYEESAIEAVKKFQKAHSMRITGVVTNEVYDPSGFSCLNENRLVISIS